MSDQFEEFEMPDYEHETTADDVIEAIDDGLHGRDWVESITSPNHTTLVLTDVNGRKFRVKVEALS